jgi:ribosomal protein L11 methylase PrmA
MAKKPTKNAAADIDRRSVLRGAGAIALAGILVAQAADVAAAYAPWFDIGVWRIEDDWALLAGRRRAAAAASA